MGSNRQESYRQARDAWAADQRVGDRLALFYPGDELRCPGVRLLSGGRRVVCGASVSGRAIATIKTAVRLVVGANSPLRCESCGSTLEIVPLLEATG